MTNRHRDPTDLTPRTTLGVDEDWFEAHWYTDRPEPAPGLLRRAASGPGHGVAALMRAIASGIRAAYKGRRASGSTALRV